MINQLIAGVIGFLFITRQLDELHFRLFDKFGKI